MTDLLWHFAKRLVYLSALFLSVLPLANAETTKILVYGDSLSAAYGIAQTDSWVHLLSQKIATKNVKIINASISGETTSGGLNRLSAALKLHKPTIIILELGANDGLQGLPIKQMQTNLRGMIKTSLKAKTKVLLIGMNVPPNYGPAYQTAFKNTYPQLAKEFKVSLVPFLLEGVAGKRELNQEDGIHPKAVAQPKLLENIWISLRPML